MREMTIFRQGKIQLKICIKYRKHRKNYVSFQLSGQIGLILAVRIFCPNWQQFPNVNHIQVFKSIFKKIPKSEKFGLPGFQTKKQMLVQVTDKNKLMDLSHKTYSLNKSENSFQHFRYFSCKIMKRKLQCISLNYVLPSDRTLDGWK